MPVLIRPDIMQSDEAIVAVIAHELHEIKQLRKLFDNGKKQCRPNTTLAIRCLKFQAIYIAKPGKWATKQSVKC